MVNVLGDCPQTVANIKKISMMRMMMMTAGFGAPARLALGEN